MSAKLGKIKLNLNTNLKPKKMRTFENYLLATIFGINAVSMFILSLVNVVRSIDQVKPGYFFAAFILALLAILSLAMSKYTYNESTKSFK